ncbi:MAG: kinase [Chthonomonadales bacterium]|nr:kinase [Chthonomonadales bacterium]
MVHSGRKPVLYIFGGLPGTGKSTLSRHLALRIRAVHLRIDTIEQALRDTGSLVSGPEGYVVAYRLAADNLRLGLDVIADSVNPIQVTRTAWKEVAKSAGVPFVEIEVVCSSETEHRNRVETRVTEIEALQMPTWNDVKNRTYETWNADVVIDTAGQTLDESLAALERALATR